MIWQRLTNLVRLRHRYTNPIEQRQAVALMVVSGIFAFVFVVWTIALFAFDVGDIDAVGASMTIVFPVIIGLVIVLIQTGRLELASWVFVFFLVVASASSVIEGLHTGGLVVVPMVSLTAAGLLLGRRGIVVVTPIVLLVLLNGAVVQSQATEILQVPPSDSAILTISISLTVYVLVALILYGFGGNIRQTVARSLNQINHTRAISQLGRDAADDTGDVPIYLEAIELLRNTMGYIFAQVYLTDNQSRIVQRLRTGTTLGEQNALVDVEVNQASVLQNAASLREVIIVSRNDREVRRSHLLPAVNFGVAVPIMGDNERVLAVLDVQTSDSNVTREEVQLIETLAQQISSLIRARQRISGLQNDLTEQAQLIDSLRRQLRVARQSASLQSDEWNEYLAGRRSDAIGFDFAPQTDSDGQLIQAANLPDELRTVIEAGEVSVTEQDGEYLMCVPVVLNESVIGAMAFTMSVRPDDQSVAMAQSVSQRLALALENKRLYEQSRALAARERKASTAANLLISATDVDAVLNLAADNFNRALGAVRTRIQLDPAAVRTDDSSTLTADSAPVLETKGNDAS